MSTESRNEFYAWLRDAHAMEEQAVKTLEAQAERLEHYPQMRTRIEQHVEETRGQARRLETCLDGIDEGTSMWKDLGGKLASMGQTIGGSMVSDEAVKGCVSSYAFEHFEIANYRALIAAAKALGEQTVRDVCEQNLAEELAMAQWLEENLGDVTRTFLSRTEQGDSEAKR
ncbi:ferritin-like domain-containing protein [Salinicola halophilus]|uniref:ferritin-like domain-containing protein n=1 Tax=Salinicola halophilus TaxID=184065 RepID=UPI000DA14EC0|nr:ferritin-like domain-containing protein [Salinicola halophilus]